MYGTSSRFEDIGEDRGKKETCQQFDQVMADMFAFQGDDAEEFGGNNGALAKISANNKRMYMDAVMMVFLFSDGLCVILTC